MEFQNMIQVAILYARGREGVMHHLKMPREENFQEPSVGPECSPSNLGMLKERLKDEGLDHMCTIIPLTQSSMAHACNHFKTVVLIGCGEVALGSISAGCHCVPPLIILAGTRVLSVPETLKSRCISCILVECRERAESAAITSFVVNLMHALCKLHAGDSCTELLRRADAFREIHSFSMSSSSPRATAAESWHNLEISIIKDKSTRLSWKGLNHYLRKANEGKVTNQTAIQEPDLMVEPFQQTKNDPGAESLVHPQTICEERTETTTVSSTILNGHKNQKLSQSPAQEGDSDDEDDELEAKLDNLARKLNVNYDSDNIEATDSNSTNTVDGDQSASHQSYVESSLDSSLAESMIAMSLQQTVNGNSQICADEEQKEREATKQTADGGPEDKQDVSIQTPSTPNSKISQPFQYSPDTGMFVTPPETLPRTSRSAFHPTTFATESMAISQMLEFENEQTSPKSPSSSSGAMEELFFDDTDMCDWHQVVAILSFTVSMPIDEFIALFIPNHDNSMLSKQDVRSLMHNVSRHTSLGTEELQQSCLRVMNTSETRDSANRCFQVFRLCTFMTNQLQIPRRQQTGLSLTEVLTLLDILGFGDRSFFRLIADRLGLEDQDMSSASSAAGSVYSLLSGEPVESIEEVAGKVCSMPNGLLASSMELFNFACETNSEMTHSRNSNSATWLQLARSSSALHQKFEFGRELHDYIQLYQESQLSQKKKTDQIQLSTASELSAIFTDYIMSLQHEMQSVERIEESINQIKATLSHARSSGN